MASAPTVVRSPRRSRAAALLAVGVLAAAARVPTLGLRRVVEGDGVHYAALARDVLAGDWSGLGNPYWSNAWPGAIAVTRLVTRLDVVTAGRVASLAAGVVLAVLVALLAERLFSATAGLAAGLAVAGHPWLIHFSTLVFTESFFACLLAGLLLAGWAAIERPSGWAAARAGVCGGLAVVTRPEGFAAIVVVLALLGLRAGRRLPHVLALGAPVLAFLALHTGICRYYYDVWDFGIGSKGTANLLIGLADDDAAKERVTSEVTASGANRLEAEMRESSLVGFTLAHPLLVARHTARNLGLLAGSAWRVFPPLPLALGLTALPGRLWPLALAALGLVWVVLAAIGLVAALADPGRRRAAIFLGATLALYALGLAPLNVHDRLVVALSPVALVFFGHGVAVAVGASAARRAIAVGALLVTGALSATAVLRAPALAYGDDPPVQREAGLWLTAHVDRDAKVMTPCPAIAFYFFEPAYEPSLKYNEVDVPWLDYHGLVAFARQREVRYLAAPEWYLTWSHHPAAGPLTDPAGAHPGLRFVVTLGTERPYRVHVYAVEPVEPVPVEPVEKPPAAP